MLMARSLEWTERFQILLYAAQGDGKYRIYFNLYICHVNYTILLHVVIFTNDVM